MVSSVFALSVLAAATVAHARLPDGRFNANTRPMATVPKVEAITNGLPVVDVNGTTIPPYNTTYYFTQLVDHKNPAAGTFQMRYWATWEFYKPGGCVVLMTPGEGNADGYSGYLTNRTINGQIAQQQNCAAFVVEHRFFGYSNPKPDLTVQSLKLLTLEQSIADFDYFAKNIKLPFNGGDQLHPDSTPWVWVGGSYSGALTSWVINSVDSFYAGYSSSGVVQAITDFWGYFTPIRENMPKNCSADVEKVIAHMDTVFTFGKKSDQQALKELFGLGAVTHNDDVTGALRNNLWDWQSDDPTSGPNSPFYQFCDALEVKDGVSAPAAGWGLNHSLHAWGNYWKTSYLANVCGSLDAEDCLTSYNSSQSYYTDTEINNSGRSWTWFTCNEVGYFQDAAPLGVPSLVSRLVQPNADLRTCSFMFGENYKNGVATLPNTLATNIKYKGWGTRHPRIYFGTGKRDPWREATVAAEGLNYPNTTDHTVGYSTDGYHCSDLLTREGVASASVLQVQRQGLDAIARWLKEFKPKHTHPKRAPAPARMRKPIAGWNGGVNPPLSQ